MTPAWYERMNQRERMLSWIIAGTIFVLLNLLMLSWIFGAVGRVHAQLAARKAALAEQALYMKERDDWTKREEWIRQHQPILKNPAEASTLLDQLKQIAGKYNVLIENPAIGSGETTPQHQTVFASIETKSPWPPLVRFLYDMQQPESSTASRTVTGTTATSIPTIMRAK